MWIGMVFETNGQVQTYTADAQVFRNYWRQQCNDNPCSVLFLCCGNDQLAIQTVVDQITTIKMDLGVGIPAPPAIPALAGTTYVYGYFNPPQPPQPARPVDWQHAFYIGVGTVKPNDGQYGGRWTEHLGDACGGGGNPRHLTIRQVMRNQPPGQVRLKQFYVNLGLVRKLYSFGGPYRRVLKFFSELFLISHGLGTHALDNDTNGNFSVTDNNTGGEYYGISRPRVFNNSPQHSYCWSEAVAQFIADPNAPTLGNTLLPSLLTLHAHTFLGQLDGALAAIGLQPLPHAPQEGRLNNQARFPNANHLDVHGAADCMLSYVRLGNLGQQNYRIDFRLSKSSNSLMINMRPNSPHNPYGAFTAYLNNHVFGNGIGAHGLSVIPGPLLAHYGGTPVRNIHQWPFYKPTAFCGNGDSAEWFPFNIGDDGAITFPPACVVIPNWLQRNNHMPGDRIDLTLVQALELVLAAFP